MKNKNWLIGLAVIAIVVVLASSAGNAGTNQGANVFDAFKNLFKGSSSTTQESTTLQIAGNGAPSGAHFNLNIIGVPKNKTSSLDSSSGRRIFVQLSGKCRIDLAMGEFSVLDGNCTDGPAKLQLPDPDTDGDGVTAYSVYVRALGKPGGKATATSCVADEFETYCSTETLALVRTSGKQSFMNASKELLTVCMDTDGDMICDTRSYLFDDAAKDYFWNYDNNGLRVAQFRFYEVPTEIGLTP